MAKPNTQMQALLDAHAALGPLPIETLSHETARQIPLLDRAAAIVYGQHIAKRTFSPMPVPIGRIEHRLIRGEDGNLLVRIYTPEGKAPEDGWPVLLYFHGGGWVLGNLDSYDASCRALCTHAQCLVVSVAYRQAPEHKWPAAPEDAFSAYQWVCANAGTIQGNAMKIAVGGESAGGNLAAVLTLMILSKNALLPIHQLLIYPVTDLENGMHSPSAQENVDAAPLNSAMLQWFYDLYLPDNANRKHPYVSPLYALNLAGLPSATVVLAQIDPLRSEGEMYARKLEGAGVDVAFKTFDGVTHEFFGMAGLLDAASDAVTFAKEGLQRAFRGDDEEMLPVLNQVVA
jgi:acetyl esterase